MAKIIQLTGKQKKQIKEAVLKYAKDNRHHPFTRVDSNVFDWIEWRLNTHTNDSIASLVEDQPSKGKTIKA
jgi:NCAIR mutase (PurE)-related protein